MPLMYPVKRVFRNWKLFIALLIGITLATTFFAGLDMKANLSAKQILDQQLKNVKVDMQFSVNLNETNLAQAIGNITQINGVKTVDTVSTLTSNVMISSNNYTTHWYVQMSSFPNSSSINKEWTNRPVGGIGENETYISGNTAIERNITVGDKVLTAIQFPTPKFDNTTTIYLNLTVAGFANITDTGYQLMTGSNFYVIPLAPIGGAQLYSYRSDLMIVSYENTLKKIWDTVPNRTVTTAFLVNVDRDKLLSPWDTQTSANNVQTVANDIQNRILAVYETHGYIMNNLGNALSAFSYSSSTFTSYLYVSIPVFFVSWYLGHTISGVSFNMRRREIGLLSTKGLSSGQIHRMFLSEGLTVGLIGGVLGIFGGLLLNQILVGGQIDLNSLFSIHVINQYTMIFTVAFGMILGFMSVYFSARRASNLPTVDALREYVPMQTSQSYRRLAWVALILGTYKMVMYALGLNLPALMSRIAFSGGSYYLVIILEPLVILDQILTYIGPLLFFWGLTNIIIQHSLKFQQLSSKISSITGDLGALAAKNVRRNPGRSAAMAFLIAFIIGYSVLVTGQLVSQQDYVVREVRYEVGADVTVNVINATKAPVILSDILGNVSGVQNSTMECQLNQQNPQTTLKTIDPESWLATAYYEKDWFTGTSMDQAFNALKADNMTIILEQRVAQQFNLKVGDQIGIDFPSGPRKLTIVGLFGPESSQSGIGNSISFTMPTWSYVPRNLFNMSSIYSDAYKGENFDTKILLRLNPEVNGTAVAEKIRSLGLEIYGVQSFDEQWQASQQMNNPYTYNSLQLLGIQYLGSVFAVLSVCVGITVVAIVSLRERSREATIMSVRGLSYWQLVWMFLSENIAIITFAVITGLIGGLIILNGTIVSTNIFTSQMVTPRFVFPTEAIVTIASYVTIIYGAAIISILVMTSQYVTNLERMVRTR